MNKLNITKQGSALIITLLVIMVISAIGIGVGRLTISEIKQTVNLENSAGAQAIAESGIEHGLLLYRFNHNAEVCAEKAADPTASCDTTSTPQIFNMGNDSDKYELKMYYMVPEIGNFDNISDSSNPTLPKDQTLELSGFKANTELTIKYQTENAVTNAIDLTTGQLRSIQHGVEFKVTNKLPDGTTESFTDFVDQYFNEVLGWDLSSRIPEAYTNFGKDSVIRIKPMDTDIKYVAGATVSGSTSQIDSGYSVIESTGYFGNTKRKLQVKINRASGSLLGTYDFVLYSGEGAL